MNTIIQTIKSQLLEKLENLGTSASPKDLQTAIGLIIQALQELHTYFKKHQFVDENEEVSYFKEVRPSILALKIEAALKYNLMVNKPIGTTDQQIEYFDKVLTSLQSYLQLNAFYYQYYKNESVELDHIYFKRNSMPLKVPIQEVVAAECDSLLAVSDLFAKFMAYESAQRFILQQVNELMEVEPAKGLVKKDNSDLHWTGDVVNLIEVAYGLWLTGQLNHGNASLGQIVRWLEGNLDIKMGNVQKRFTEIERRKRISTTKYLDQMTDAVRTKLEAGNS